MVEKKTLTQEELEEKIEELVPNWKTGKNERAVPFIERVKHASTYMEGIGFVNKVAEAAEAAEVAEAAKVSAEVAEAAGVAEVG